MSKGIFLSALAVILVVLALFLAGVQQVSLAAPRPTVEAVPYTDSCTRLLCAGQRPSFCPPPMELPELMCAKFQPRRRQ
ncbi:MAG: hypothetical protein DYG88_07305 [Chloroflexi bacterium CFX4]|nr:hypothetical protein [Chloroflexi bacterium CFX4]MDL1921979.1 hypothetical protein [Chloroflexi bacterium CFX3]